jgi:HEXXH motif-containing protein
MVAEVQAGNADAVQKLAARLLTLGGVPHGLGIHPADPGETGARPIAFFSRFVDLEEDNRMDLGAPDPAKLPAAIAQIEEALALIARNDPGLDAELRAFIVDLALVSQADGHLFTTSAVSCFQNWGCLVFNPTPQRDALDVVEVLAHEATHLQLFALALDEALLTNAPEERYYSPLRDALRTMDGVFHATIVAGRVARALLRQAHATDEPAEMRATAFERATRSTRQFDEGVAIVEAHARLTPLGRRVLDDSKAAMTDLRELLLSPA